MDQYNDPTAVNGEYTDGDDLANPPVPRTVLRSIWTNMIQRELINVVEGAGLTLDGEEFDQVFKAILALINQGGGGRVGEIVTMAQSDFTTPPAGFLPMDGSLVSRASYPELWAFAQNNARLVSDINWSASLSSRPSFSSGNGSSTFRVPDVRGLFLRWWGGSGTWDAARTAMTMQQDALQNITGEMNLLRLMAATVTTSGAFGHTRGSDFDEDFVSGNDGHPYSFTFDASRVVRTDDETRAINAAFPAFIRYRSVA